MSVDHPVSQDTAVESDTSMFPATPIWERGRKRRRFGTSRPAARSMAPTATIATPPAAASAPLGVLTADALVTPAPAFYPATPRSVTETTYVETPPPAARVVRRSGLSPAAIAGGLLAVGAVALASWFVMQRPDDTADKEQLVAALNAQAAAVPMAVTTAPVMPMTTPVTLPPATIVAPPMMLPLNAAPASAPRVVVFRQAPAPIAPVAPRMPAPDPVSVNASAAAPRLVEPAPDPAPPARLEIVPAPEVTISAPAPAPAAPVVVSPPEPESPA